MRKRNSKNEKFMLVWKIIKLNKKKHNRGLSVSN